MSRALVTFAILCVALVALPARAARYARAADGPAEWLPADDPLLREFELLRASGLADTASVAFTRPIARKTMAAVVARARRLHPESRDPSLARLERAFGQELIDRGYDAPRGWTRPLVTRAETADDEADETDAAARGDAAPFRLRLASYADAALIATRDRVGFEERSRAGGRLDVESGGLLVHLDAWTGRLRDATRFSDPLVHGSDYVAYSEDAYLSYSTRRIDATFGRARFGWGPGAEGSLLWSKTADPVTFLALGSTIFRHLRVTALHADVDATRGARLAGHRLEWFPSPRLSIGAAEAVRYTSSTWEPLYVVSLLPYTWVQRLVTEDALDRTGAAEPLRNNVMASLDVSWRVAPGRVIYGEFLLDDQGLAKGGQPTRIGYQLGGLATGALGAARGSARLEYSRVYNYVYSVFYGEDFIHHSKPIGFPLGPDSRRVALDVRIDPSAAWELRAAGAMSDRGEGTIGRFFDPDSGDASGSALSGVVERTRTVTLGARWWPRDAVDVGVELERAWIANAAHVENADVPRTTARLRVRIHK